MAFLIILVVVLQMCTRGLLNMHPAQPASRRGAVRRPEDKSARSPEGGARWERRSEQAEQLLVGRLMAGVATGGSTGRRWNGWPATTLCAVRCRRPSCVAPHLSVSQVGRRSSSALSRR